MGLRKYNKKRRPQTPDEMEDYVGRKYTFWLFIITLVVYYFYQKFK